MIFRRFLIVQSNNLDRVFQRKISVSVCCLKIVPSNLKNKSKSSQEWLTRQLNDPYIARAKMENYRARSAFKLIEIDDKFKLLKPGHVVVDCGAAPGAWTQVATKRVNARQIDCELPVGKVIAVDLNYISPIEGAIIISRGDFTTSDCQRVVVDALNGQQPDVIISDMAPNASGIRELDCENIVSLASSALLFAFRTLKVGGTFMCKVWDSGNLPSFAKTMEKYFTSFKRVKPTASRSESAELFLLGMHFKGVEVSSLKHDQ